MPRYIIKPDPDVDLYVDWSTVTDTPLGWGTADQLDLKPVHKERADLTGTSSVHGFDGWDDGPLLISEMGTSGGGWSLPRESLRGFIEELSATADSEEEHEALLARYATKV